MAARVEYTYFRKAEIIQINIQGRILETKVKWKELNTNGKRSTGFQINV